MMKLTKTPLMRCYLTGMTFPLDQFSKSANGKLSFMGLLWTNVSQRAINGRYSAARGSHYPHNSHHRKGIKMYKPWVNDPSAFAWWVLSNLGYPRFVDGEKVSLDRIDNDGDYVPGNLRWATSLEQVWNSDGRGSIWHG